MTVAERLLRHFKFELPETSITELTIGTDLVDDPASTLASLLAGAEVVGDSKVISEITAFRRRFEEEHGVRLTFDSEAVTRVAALSAERGQSALQLCEEKFRDFQFGLQLIRKNTGQKNFPVTAEAVEDPDRYLSNLVVSSYRDETGESPD